MLSPVHHVIGLTTIVRERLLPISGEVIARAQQKVTAGEVVAQTHWSREHALLDVARILGVSPAAADKLIKCKVDDQVTASAEIAVGRGMFPKSVRAPKDGRVVAVGGGQVLLEVGEAKLELERRLARQKAAPPIVAVEAADRMTERQIAAKVRKVFKQ